jgi:hypothetical protein
MNQIRICTRIILVRQGGISKNYNKVADLRLTEETSSN